MSQKNKLVLPGHSHLAFPPPLAKLRQNKALFKTKSGLKKASQMLLNQITSEFLA